MFKAIRVFILLVILLAVSVGTWLSQARSTDWNNSLYVKVYPINGDGNAATQSYIDGLELSNFEGIETFMQREVERYGKPLQTPVRMRLGSPIGEQPPAVPESGNVLGVMLWSLRMRWWARSVAGPQDNAPPDVRIFVRYHSPDRSIPLDNSVGLQKGMIGIVNAYASHARRGYNNVVIAHEFLHTLGASDKYDPSNGRPLFPHGFGEPDRSPLYPQRYAEIMGGRIAIEEGYAEVPKSLKLARVGEATALEIGLR